MEAGAPAGMPVFLQQASGHRDLTPNPGSDVYEQEADRVARAVQSRDGHSLMRPSQSVYSNGNSSLSSDRRALDSRMGTGMPLPKQTREALEDMFGNNFSDVRIHSDRHANRLSRTLGANAFTTGRDIYFNENQYDPQSQSGRALLAHELTHVVQQGEGGAGPIQCDMMESLAPTALGGFELGLATRNAPADPGMDGTIEFHPAPSGPYSSEITLIQTANVVDVAGTTTGTHGIPAPADWKNINAGEEAPRNEVRTPLGGTFVDIPYATEPQSSSTTPNYDRPAYIAANAALDHHGWLRSPTDLREASLYDYPSASYDSDFKFETVAKGSDNQVVYGSLDWGFQVRSGVVQSEYRHPHAFESAEFDEALERFRGYYAHEPIVIYFDTGRDVPLAGEVAKLGDVTNYMARYPDVRMQVDGYADETGSANAAARANYNIDLSYRRAENAVTLLLGLGVDESRIDLTVGRGQTTTFSPGSPVATPGNLRANRRVVISFVRTASSLISP